MGKTARRLGLSAIMAALFAFWGTTATATTDFNFSDPQSVFSGNPTLIDLGRAISRDDLEAVKSIIQRAPESLNTLGQYDISPLMFAVLNQRPKAVEVLVRLGADPYQLTSKEANLGAPITFALRATKGPDLLAVMLAAGASIEGGQDGRDKPLLLNAIMLPGDARLKQLIVAGANVNISDAVGNSALEKCINSNQYEKAEFLLAAGANPFLGRMNPLLLLVRDHDNWEPGTPNDTARQRLIQALRAKGLTEDTVMKPGPKRKDVHIVKPQ